MSTVGWRCIFLALLLATAADKIQAWSVETSDTHSAIIDALARQGLAASKHSVPLRSDLPAWVLFAAPGCDRMLQVLPATLSLHELPLLEALVEPGYSRRYIYLGRTWPTADRLAMRIAWLKHKAASVLGFGRYALLKTVLLVASPPECNVVEQIDWQPVWELARARGQGNSAFRR